MTKEKGLPLDHSAVNKHSATANGIPSYYRIQHSISPNDIGKGLRTGKKRSATASASYHPITLFNRISHQMSLEKGFRQKDITATQRT